MLSLTSRAPSVYQKVVPKAFTVSVLCFPTWLETAQQREKGGKKKDFPRGNTQLSLKWGLPQHARVRSSYPFIYPYKLLCESWRRSPALSPSRNPIQPPCSESARHPRLFTHSSSFDIFPAPRLPGWNDGSAPGTEALLTAHL